MTVQCPSCRSFNTSFSQFGNWDFKVCYSCFCCFTSWSGDMNQKEVGYAGKSDPSNYIVVVNPYIAVEDKYATCRKTYTKEQAINVAKSLAAQYPGKKYYVAQLVGYASIANTIYEEI